MIRAVTVYCSSSGKVAPVYRDAAEQLGRAIAAQGWDLVYGGNRIGMMGVLADAARAAGGKVIGITPQWFIDDGHGDDRCHELLIPADMRQRKHLLQERGDALIALPGGLGTLEELLEVIVSRHLGQHQKPIILLNIADYYAPLLAMIRHGIEHHFIKPAAMQQFHVAGTVEAAIALLRQHQSATSPAPAVASL